MVSSLHLQARIWRLSFVLVPVGVALALLSMLLAACGSDSSTTADPYARYRPALKPAYESQLDTLELVPRYDLDITYDAEAQSLRGTASIVLYNPTQDPWRYLIFRLYPALEQYGGGILIQGAAVNGYPAPFDNSGDASILRVNLAEPLEKDQRATVQLSWQTRVPQWTDASSIYALFGVSQQITSLPLFYPSLAVYEPGPTIGAGHWWTETGSVRGDAAFNYTSLFVVTATLPADQIPVTSGTLVSSTFVAGNQARHVWVTGPIREFLLQMSPLFQSAYTETYGTRVTSFWLPGQEAAGREALTYAIASLRIYSDQFGPYPYRDLRVAPAPLGFRGMEYPQTVLLGTELYTRFRENLEPLVAHEIAHQWWYLVVHNDPVNEPWLDEALAEYSMKIYMEKLHGRRDASTLINSRWETPWSGLRAKGEDTLVDQPVAAFRDGSQYETIVYAKGALFYEALRAELGDRAFFRFLHTYLATHRYGIVDTATWEADLAALQNPTVDALYREWIAQPLNPLTKSEQTRSDAPQ